VCVSCPGRRRARLNEKSQYHEVLEESARSFTTRSRVNMWKFHNRLRWALWGVALSLAIVTGAIFVIQAV
jgi:hypothetical protein